MTRLFFCAVLIAVASLTFGCKESEFLKASKKADLTERVEQYHDRFRWRDFETASMMVVPSMRGDFMVYADTIRRGYAIENYAVKSINVSDSGDQAAVSVRRSFIESTSVVLQTQDLIQQWIYKEGGWYLAGPPY